MNGTTGPAGGNGQSLSPEEAMNLHLMQEAQRAARRRDTLFGRGSQAGWEHDHGLDGTPGPGPGNWALALSGGGIRSATFCLGVIQELARPSAAAVQGLPPQAQAASVSVGGLLPQFDYVSSVSGGGFVAGFLQGLYARQPGSPVDAATAVNAHLAQEPPPRVRAGTVPSPLAWLRENGRYLAPSGSGDIAYAFGFGARNWLGIHSVIGAPLVLAVALLALLAKLLVPHLAFRLLDLWLLPLAVFVMWVLPTAGAYWMTRDVPENSHLTPMPWVRVGCVLLAALAAVVSAQFSAVTDLYTAVMLAARGGKAVFSPAEGWPTYFTLCGLVLLFTVVWAEAVRYAGPGTFHAASDPLPGKGKKSNAKLAVVLTHLSAVGFQLAGAALLLALVLEIAFELLAREHDTHPILISGGGAGVLALAYRLCMKVTPLLRGSGSSLGKVRGIARRSLGLGLALLGTLLALAVAIFWATAAQWLMLSGEGQSYLTVRASGATSLQALATLSWRSIGYLASVAGLFVLVAGRWESILNMSGYHHFYSARLTRAYLGAANPARTTAGDTPAAAGAHNSVVRFVDGDFFDYASYHARLAAPLHLINATLNETVDPSEQLVQRDRKGKPFLVLPWLHPIPEAEPDAARVDVAIDGKFFRVAGDSAALHIGDWLAVSGAAVSTGMGRQTSFGASLCVTLANARIGRWWPGSEARDGFWRWLLPTYCYLADEMRAKFDGTHRRLRYLTDGAHFENTAIYELLRRVRHRDTAVRFIMMCDCGADNDYRYDDLANLVRLARVDFGLEIEVDCDVDSDPDLKGVFGTPATMGLPDLTNLDDRCAMLLRVREAGVTLAHIVMIKPRLVSCASSDLLAYYRNNPVFPQQTTGDQFFDDEQWESYRKLGLECCRAILNLGTPLWRRVL